MFEAGARLPAVTAGWLHIGWRPAIGWVCVAVLLVEGVVLRLAQLFGSPVEPLSFGELMPFVVAVVGLAAAKTAEKITGSST